MLKGYRTLILAIVLTTVGILETLDWVSILPPEYKSYALIMIPVVFGLLRVITTTAIGEKEEDAS